MEQWSNALSLQGCNSKDRGFETARLLFFSSSFGTYLEQTRAKKCESKKGTGGPSSLEERQNKKRRAGAATRSFESGMVTRNGPVRFEEDD